MTEHNRFWNNMLLVFFLVALSHNNIITMALAEATTAAEDEDPLISKWPEFLSWYRSHGGIVDDRITIGYEPNSTLRGMIATSPIAAETILIHTPHNLVLSAGTGNGCDNIELILSEMNKGIGSKWFPMLDFDGSSGSRVPYQWDRGESTTTSHGVNGGVGGGRAIQELQGLPPAGETHKDVEWAMSQCLPNFPQYYRMNEEEREQYWKAAHAFHTRSADMGMVPMYGFLNHHNGKVNTRLMRDDEGGLFVIALNDIEEGDPIYLTYARSGIKSSIDVFNGYGFVEDYPQLWRWGGEGLVEGKDNDRYIVPISDHFQPNHPLYEILLVSPTLAALSPTKQLVSVLGNTPRSLEEWSKHIHAHHVVLLSSHVRSLHDAALHLLNGLPTTLEEDEKILEMAKQEMDKKLSEKMRMEEDDSNKKDVLQAIEYRMAFKKALRLAVQVAETEGLFYVDRKDEL